MFLFVNSSVKQCCVRQQNKLRALASGTKNIDGVSISINKYIFDGVIVSSSFNLKKIIMAKKKTVLKLLFPKMHLYGNIIYFLQDKDFYLK